MELTCHSERSVNRVPTVVIILLFFVLEPLRGIRELSVKSTHICLRCLEVSRGEKNFGPLDTSEYREEAQ